MARLSLLGVLLLAVAPLPILAVAPLPTPDQHLTHNCTPGSYYHADSTFQSNLNDTLYSLPLYGYATGFFNYTVGDAPDRVYGLVLCRGDVSKADCRNCLDTVAQEVVSLCPEYRSAIVWHEYCMLRYTDRQLSSADDPFMFEPIWSVWKLTEVTLFNKQLDLLMRKLVSYATENTWAHMFATGEAAYVDPKHMFATGEATYVDPKHMLATGEVAYVDPQNPKIYGYVQCAMYLSANDCKNCLEEGIRYMPSWAFGKAGALYLTTTCNIRYSLAPFYQGSPMVSVPPAAAVLQPPAASPRPPIDSPTAQGEKSSSTGTVLLAIAIPVGAAFALLISV